MLERTDPRTEPLPRDDPPDWSTWYAADRSRRRTRDSANGGCARVHPPHAVRQDPRARRRVARETATRANPRAGPAHHRHPPSPEGACGASLLAPRVPGRPSHRAQRRRDRVPRVRGDVPGTRARGDAPGRTDGVRGRHRSDERQRPLREHPGRRRHRRLRRSHAGRSRRANSGGAHPGGRGTLPRRAALGSVGHERRDRQQPDGEGAAPDAAVRLPRRARPAHRAWTEPRRVGLPPADGRHDRARACMSGREHHRRPRGRAARVRPVRRQA